MAIALDANLGSNSTDSASPLTVSTGSAVATGAKIFVCVSWFNSSTSMTVSGGSLSWSSLKQTDNGNDHFAIWSADAPAGLASATSISALQTFATRGGILMNCTSFTGLATGTASDTTNQATSTGASWSSGSATNTSPDALFIGGAGNETVTSTSSTPTAGSELADVWNTLAQQGFAVGYTIAATSAARAITGSWVGAASTANTGSLVVFPAAAAAAGTSYVPHRMPLGV